MYRIINENIDNILTKEAIKHFKDYYYLLDTLQKVNVAENMEYQRKYKGYWVMGRLSEKYYKKYFELLETNKRNKNISLDYIVKELNVIDGKIQFSFSSKLIHMINNDKPIYDSKISTFYKLPQWKGTDYDERVDKINKIYDFLLKEDKRIKDDMLLNLSINKVRNRYDLDEVFTDEKVIDSIIWLFVNYAESGIGIIKYK